MFVEGRLLWERGLLTPLTRILQSSLASLWSYLTSLWSSRMLCRQWSFFVPCWLSEGVPCLLSEGALVILQSHLTVSSPTLSLLVFCWPLCLHTGRTTSVLSSMKGSQYLPPFSPAFSPWSQRDRRQRAQLRQTQPILFPLRLSSTSRRVDLPYRRQSLRLRGCATTGRTRGEARGRRKEGAPQKWTLRRWCCWGRVKKVSARAVRVRWPFCEWGGCPGGRQGIYCSYIRYAAVQTYSGHLPGANKTQ